LPLRPRSKISFALRLLADTTSSHETAQNTFKLVREDEARVPLFGFVALQPPSSKQRVVRLFSVSRMGFDAGVLKGSVKVLSMINARRSAFSGNLEYQLPKLKRQRAKPAPQKPAAILNTHVLKPFRENSASHARRFLPKKSMRV
jgi:hypothetical protein